MRCNVELAVNLPDLDRVSPFIREILLRGKITLKKAILVDRDRYDELAVKFTCDLLTAACACDVLRTKDRREKRYPTRVYLRTKKAWTKIPGDKALTLVKDGDLRLNPEVFPGVFVSSSEDPRSKRRPAAALGGEQLL